MTIDLEFVAELRTLFKGGATPSAIVRRIAERHQGEPMLDRTVRDYFREAFDVPVARIGPEMVRAILGGDGVPALNHSLLHRMIEARSAWDTEVERSESWLNAVTATNPAALVAEADPHTIPELAGSWDRLDDGAKTYIRRMVGNAGELYEGLNALAVLAERLQQQVSAAVNRRVA